MGRIKIIQTSIVVGLILVMLSSAYAQVNVHFQGLKRTKLDYIAFNVEGLISSSNSEQLIWDIPISRVNEAEVKVLRQNLINLAQIQDAQFIIEDSQKGSVVCLIKESQAIFPLFSFGGVEGNINFLVGVNHQNVFGRGAQFTAFYQSIQKQHNFLLSYRLPNFKGSRFGTFAEIRRYAAFEPVYFDNGQALYRYINQSYSSGLNYNLSIREILGFGATFFTEDFLLIPEENTPSQAPLDLVKNKLLLKLQYQRDRRDYNNERISGHQQQTIFETVSSVDDPLFWIALFEWKSLFLVKNRGNLGLRLRLGLASNIESPFSPFTLDSQLNIRGSGNRIDRGTAQAVLNTEYRHRIWRDKKGNISIQAVAFSDLGSWRTPGGEFKEFVDGSLLRHFIGGGFRFISPRAQNAVIRVDYGFDTSNANQNGLVVGFGQYF